jgi:signal transduction histidine kinase
VKFHFYKLLIGCIGLGLIGIGERAALINGEVEIESAIGNGTTIYVRVPTSYEKVQK